MIKKKGKHAKKNKIKEIRINHDLARFIREDI